MVDWIHGEIIVNLCYWQLDVVTIAYSIDKSSDIVSAHYLLWWIYRFMILKLIFIKLMNIDMVF